MTASQERALPDGESGKLPQHTLSLALRYTSLDTTTMVMLARRADTSGVNLVASTALGSTDTREGGSAALSTVFSLDVCETQITWLISASVNISSLLVRMDEASAKPKRE